MGSTSAGGVYGKSLLARFVEWMKGSNLLLTHGASPFRQNGTRYAGFGDDRRHCKIVNEAIKGDVQVNLIINDRAGGNVPLIAQKTTDKFDSQKEKGLF